MHQPELAKSLGKNTLAGIIARAAQIGTRFITAPLVIAHLGLGGYGIWAVIINVAAYMRFGSVGVKMAFQKYIAEKSGSGEMARINELLSTGCAGMLAISLLGVPPFFIFSGNIMRWLDIPQQYVASTESSIKVLAIIMLLSNAGSVFEAIVMGAHRTDIVRRYTTVLTIAEAAAIAAALFMGKGLFAMACIMALSETFFICACFRAARRVAPEVRLSIAHLRMDAVPELLRFAGSFQLVNLLEVVYVGIVPMILVREFGVEKAGIYSIVGRLVGAAQILSEPFLQPLLSGAAMVFSSGSSERMKDLLKGAFRVNLSLSLLPLAFLANFGEHIVLAWTGERSPLFAFAFPIVCASSLVSSFSLLQLVLYRASGRGLLDNIRQLIRLATLSAIVIFAGRLGFIGVLSGLLTAEAIGAGFMLIALVVTFPMFKVSHLMPDVVRISLASAASVALAHAAFLLPLPLVCEPRSLSALKVAVALCFCLLAAIPAARLTGALSGSEYRRIAAVFARRRLAA